jgi:quercetin dioxygenase-like cupin family protein
VTSTSLRRRVAALTLVLVVGIPLGATACGGSTDNTATATGATGAAGPATTAPAVVKSVLAQEKDPPGAPGRTLSLVRYTIAPGAQLPAHIHPGAQLASIESGTLTYTVVSGTATVTRKGSSTPESVTGPATTTLGPGDAVAENDGMVHYGANETDAPVVILASLLTDSSQDLAVNVTTTATPRT